MSVWMKLEDEPIGVFDNYPLDKRTCFLCGEKVRHPMIHWMACDSTSSGFHFFHPNCAMGIIIRLSRDVLEWEHKQREPK